MRNRTHRLLEKNREGTELYLCEENELILKKISEEECSFLNIVVGKNYIHVQKEKH